MNKSITALVFSLLILSTTAVADPHRPINTADATTNQVIAAEFGMRRTAIPPRDGFVTAGRADTAQNTALIQFVSTKRTTPETIASLEPALEEIIQIDVSPTGDKLLAVSKSGVAIIDLATVTIETTLQAADHFDSLATNPIMGGVFGNDNNTIVLFFAGPEPESLIIFDVPTTTKVGEYLFLGQSSSTSQAGFQRLKTNSDHSALFLILSDTDPAHELTKFSLAGTTLTAINSIELPDLFIPETLSVNQDGTEVAVVEWDLTVEDDPADEVLLSKIHFYDTDSTFNLTQTLTTVDATHIASSFSQPGSNGEDFFTVASMDAVGSLARVQTYDRNLPVTPPTSFPLLGRQGEISFPAGSLGQNETGDFAILDGAIAAPSSIQILRTSTESTCWDFFYCDGKPVTSCGKTSQRTGRRTIRGTENVDVLAGGDTNDNLFGYGSNDFLCGNGGVDKIDGGLGDDFILAGDGDDRINGREGMDTIYAEAGNDRIKGGPGEDFISGGPGNDTIRGDEDNDTLMGDDDADTVRGGLGDDIIHGGLGNDRLLGNDGNDTLNGDEDNDEINGGNGDDIANGGDGDDLLKGSDGNDTLTGDLGIDNAIGGRDIDTCDAETTHRSCES